MKEKGNTPSIDTTLQQKYRDTVGSIFGIDHANKGYFIPPSDEFVIDMGTAFLLRNSSVILSGAPGVGKTSVLRILSYHLTGDKDALAVVNCTQDLRAEDFLYEVLIQYREYLERKNNAEKKDDNEPEKITAIVFEPKPRPVLTRKFSLINEVNRLCSRSANALLSVLAERSIVVHGKTLSRATGIILMDMNPHVSGPLEWGFVDRIRANIHVSALDMGAQLKLLKLKHGEGKNLEELVEYAMQVPSLMNAEELATVWEDVDRVVLDEETFSSLVLFTNVFCSCKYDLSTKWMAFELPCQECEFKETCIVRQLEHPIFTRSLDHIVKMLKAEAYFKGRTRVELKEDILPALRRVMMHRLQVKPEYASRYVNAQLWYDKEVEQRILELQKNWMEAKASYDKIVKALKEKHETEAAKLYNTLRKQSKDPVSLKVVEMLESTIEAAAEARFGKMYAKCLSYESAGYEKSNLDEFSSVEEELPPKLAEQLTKLRDKLLARLSSVIEIRMDEYKNFVLALAKAEPSAADMATNAPRSWGKADYNLADGSKIEVRTERERYIVTFNAQTSAVADAIRQFSSTAE